MNKRDIEASTTVGILIDGVWIDNRIRSYRAITTMSDDPTREHIVRFAEFYYEDGKRKTRSDEKNTAKAQLGANSVYNLALALVSREPKN